MLEVPGLWYTVVKPYSDIKTNLLKTKSQRKGKREREADVEAEQQHDLLED